MKKNNMENFFTPDKIIGKVSKEEKERLVEKKKEIFQNQQFEDLKDIEAKKSPEILEAIDLANNATNEFRIKYGLDKIDVPPENIHFIKHEAEAKDESPLSSVYRGIFETDKLRILIAENDLPILAETLVHEILHMKSLHSFDIDDEKQYKGGLGIISRNKRFKGVRYFSVLNEAMTETITKSIIQREMAKNSPIFEGLAESTRKAIEKYPEATNFGGSLIFNNYLFYAKENKDGVFVKLLNILLREKPQPVFVCHFSYQREQDILNIIIDKLFEKNKEQFNDREEVYLLFEKSYITGNMLELGILIDRTFGSGTFRKFGNLDHAIIEDQEQQNFLNNL